MAAGRIAVTAVKGLWCDGRVKVIALGGDLLVIEYLKEHLEANDGSLDVTLTLVGQNAGGNGQLRAVDNVGIVFEAAQQMRCHPWSAIVRLKLG